jgi:amidase
MTDKWNAISIALDIGGAQTGGLASKTFVVKENIDVEGRLSTNGNPVWAASHAPAALNAPAVDRLLAAGARLTGKTQMDEMAYSLLGANFHYGTPINPAAPQCHPGGSSSGSAVAVAAGLADFALGTDTAGSCRAPAAFCGVFGFRPSHGAISSNGVVPLAETLDTIGWFARDMETMTAVGDALLPQDLNRAHFASALILTDAFTHAEVDFLTETKPALSKSPVDLSLRELELGEDFSTQALGHFRNLQAFEAWRAHGDWIKAAHPCFGPGIKERFQFASTVTIEQKQDADAFRINARKTIGDVLGAAAIFVVPTTPFTAPLLTAGAEELDLKRQQMVRLLLLASFFGLPQISIPLSFHGAPLGLSLIGPRWSDRALLELAQRFCESFSAQA